MVEMIKRMLQSPLAHIEIRAALSSFPVLRHSGGMRHCLMQENRMRHTIVTAARANEPEIMPGSTLLGMKGTNVDHMTCNFSSPIREGQKHNTHQQSCQFNTGQQYRIRWIRKMAQQDSHCHLREHGKATDCDEILPQQPEGSREPP